MDFTHNDSIETIADDRREVEEILVRCVYPFPMRWTLLGVQQSNKLLRRAQRTLRDMAQSMSGEPTRTYDIEPDVDLPSTVMIGDFAPTVVSPRDIVA